MARRSPARFLAPVALVAVAAALYVVVAHGLPSSGGSTPNAHQTPTASPTGGKARHHRRHRRTYTVKPGDTPSEIALRTGVPLATLQRLNPRLDPQTLAPGQKIRLRR